MIRRIIRWGRWTLFLFLAAGLARIGLQTPHPIAATAVADSEVLASATPASDTDPQFLDDSDTQDLTGLQEKFSAVSRRVAPSVVAISAAENATESDSANRADDMNGQKLEDVLAKTTRTVGTGFIFDSDGYILTNEHVIEDSEQFWVTTDDHRIFPAIVVGADPRADLAVLKIPASNLPAVKFCSVPCLRGQWALTLGNPYGLATEGEMSLSVGVISATDRALPRLAIRENRLYTHLIQTTAEINPGNSGGPLFNLSGEVIGINAAVILPQKQTNGIGFALPVNPQLLQEVNELRQGREVVYGYLGVIVNTPTISERRDLGLPTDAGVRIEAVESGAPAAGSDGLRPADVVIKFEGTTITDSDQFVRLVGAAPVGQSANLRVLRDCKFIDIKVTPTKRPQANAISSANQRLHWRGIVLGPVPANWPGGNKTSSGLMVLGISNDSPLKRQGITVGTIVTAIGNHPVSTITDFQNVLNEIPADQWSVQTAQPAAQIISLGR
jgi:serine protease Do